MLQLVKTLRAFGTQARAALPPTLHRYLDERIVVSNWYPHTDYLALMSTVIAVVPLPAGVDPWEHFGRLAAQYDLSRVYKGMVRGSSLVGALKAVRDLFSLYQDIGRIEVTGDDERACIELFDFTIVSVPHCRFMSSMLREHVRLALGRDVVIVESQCRGRGDGHCRREVR
jgi:hypothetical protein